MVESFAALRLQGKPLADVNAFIEHMTPKPDAEQVRFYEKLARVTYGLHYPTPQQARKDFIAYCLGDQ